jgi:hypothetical protein
MDHIDLATEDELSEAVGLRLLAEVSGVQPGLLLRQGGNGYLRSRLKAFCEMARNRPMLVLTDLDTLPCPMALRTTWFGRLTQPADLHIRVAVREVEAWLLADHVAMAGLLGVSIARRLPDDPDSLPDPKAFLLQIARRAPRNVRLDLCAPPAAIARQGLAYNARLCGFVREHWDPVRAAARSESLSRTRLRLQSLAR